METAIKFTLIFLAGVSAWYWLCKWGEEQARSWDTSHLQRGDSYAPNPRERRLYSIIVSVIGLGIVALRLATSGADIQTIAVTTCLAAAMGASAATDIRFYMLPLSLTVLGIGLALLLLSRQPSFIAALSGIYAIVLIGATYFLHKTAHSETGMGDYLVILWIALAAPLNGIFTTGLGMLALAILPRVLPKLAAWRQKISLPVGGIWLSLAVLVMAFPPYPELIYDKAAPISALPAAAPAALPEQSSGEQTLLNTLRLQALETQSEVVGRIALAETRDGRIQEAQKAAPVVEKLQREYAPVLTPEDKKGLALLAQALERYDIDAVRELSGQFAAARESIAQQIEQ